MKNFYTQLLKTEKISNMKHPDPKRHQQISFIKSGFRILGYVGLAFYPIPAVGVLVFSELIGIYEELV